MLCWTSQLGKRALPGFRLIQTAHTHTKTATALLLLIADFVGFTGSILLSANSFSSRTKGGRTQQNIL